MEAVTAEAGTVLGTQWPTAAGWSAPWPYTNDACNKTWAWPGHRVVLSLPTHHHCWAWLVADCMSSPDGDDATTWRLQWDVSLAIFTLLAALSRLHGGWPGAPLTGPLKPCGWGPLRTRQGPWPEGLQVILHASHGIGGRHRAGDTVADCCTLECSLALYQQCLQQDLDLTRVESHVLTAHLSLLLGLVSSWLHVLTRQWWCHHVEVALGHQPSHRPGHRRQAPCWGHSGWPPCIGALLGPLPTTSATRPGPDHRWCRLKVVGLIPTSSRLGGWLRGWGRGQ